MISVSRNYLCTTLCVLCVLCGESFSADWPTARGNPQRTGCVDNQAGPASPKVLWVYKSQDHFIASLVPGDNQLHAAGLGAFNVASVMALPLEPNGMPAALWTKSTPLVKNVVSAPAIGDGKVVFGDGMHQDAGGTLHCLRADGRPLWQLRMPGDLIHLEGSPTVAGKRVYMGAGSAGVLCVERDRVTLDGKERGDAEIQKLIDAKWKELQAKYEVEKKKDPDFAVPPSEDQLPKPEPVKVWQQGAGKWHVDAPVAVVADRVLICSAFLDKEQVGDRAVICLDARDGKQLWRQQAPMNPWGGAAVIDKLVVVAGSTLNYDPKELKKARGFIAAFDLESGKPKWQKEIPGGVVGGVALSNDVAITCATDGKVRAFDLASGERRWIYDTKSALFAPAAVSQGVAYVGDLKGTIHAISLTGGKAKWVFDLGTDPAVKAPGMIYGGPTLHAGKLYVATCNLEGPHARQPTAVVCIGSK